MERNGKQKEGGGVRACCGAHVATIREGELWAARTRKESSLVSVSVGPGGRE